VQADFFKAREVGSGFIGVMPKPRPGDWLIEELTSLQQQGVNVIVSLLESWEEQELGLSEEQSYCQRLGINFLSHPIKDRGLPSDIQSFTALTTKLNQLLQDGAGIAIHCRAGIGRSGITAIAVLITLGSQVDDAISEVSDARGIPVPDTSEQIDWLYDHAHQFEQPIKP